MFHNNISVYCEVINVCVCVCAVMAPRAIGLSDYFLRTHTITITITITITERICFGNNNNNKKRDQSMKHINPSDLPIRSLFFQHTAWRPFAKKATTCVRSPSHAASLIQYETIALRCIEWFFIFLSFLKFRIKGFVRRITLISQIIVQLTLLEIGSQYFTLA